MKLFAFYIGGSTPTSLIEVHDARFGVGEKIDDCYDDIRKSWWGTPESLHLDCWGELNAADGHDIVLKDTPAEGDSKLWFVNLGGYDPADFNELHKNVFVVAPSESKAKVRALKMILDWKSHHKDYLYEVEKIFSINDAVSAKGLHIHLVPNPDAKPFKFDMGYNPIFKKSA
jgi:hypothetical protein